MPIQRNKYIVQSLAVTLPETNMETQKGPYKDYSPFEGGLHVSLGECTVSVWGPIQSMTLQTSGKPQPDTLLTPVISEGPHV